MKAGRNSITGKTSRTRAASRSEPDPTPHVGRLETINDVKDEFARLYRAARKGTLEAAKAAKLGYLLSQLAALIRDNDLEQRLATLEQRHGKA